MFHVIQLGNPPRKLWTRRWPRAYFLSGSPDGRWLATGTIEGGSGVGVWETRSGRLERQWPLGDAEVAFSPDGRWLAATTGRISVAGAECQIWHVGSWEPGPRIPLVRLRFIRERLTELGLDWDAPPLPPVATVQRGTGPEEP